MNDEGKKENEKKSKNVEIIVEVSPDETEAYITLIPSSESPGFSADDIRKALSKKGIKFGIKEEVLITLGAEEKFHEKILIATGVKPKKGKNGEIRHLVDTKKPVKIKKGEKIAEIIPPEDGIEGLTIFEKKIPSIDGKKVKIPNLVNADFSDENPDIIVSKIDGYLVVDNISVYVKPFFELEILKDDYEAHITVHNPINDDDFGSEDIKQFLKDNNIIYGVKEEVIENIFQKKSFEQSILIASGQRVIDGKDGEIRYYFDPEVKPKVNNKGNVNYKELSLIQNVKKGQKIVEVIPPVEGVEGYTVLGKKIPPKIGKPYPLPSGKNAEPDPNNPNILTAGIDGHVMLKGKNIEIDPVFVIKESVDFSTGNVDYIGSVIVNGDVRSGFYVKAKNDIEVNGIVEDAVIEAGGNVLIKTGFVGRGEGKIIAEGKVMIKFCENENIISGDDIIIGEYLMHSNIQTKGKLNVTEQKGIIVGGEIFAIKGVEANIIGNKNYTPTKIFVGINKEIKEKINEKKSFLMKNLDSKKEVEKATHMLMRRKLIKKELPENKKGLFDKLKQVKEKIEKEEKILISEIENSEKELVKFKDSIVKVLGVVYPGTSITIFNKQTEVNEAFKNVFYKYTEKEILAVDLSELK